MMENSFIKGTMLDMSWVEIKESAEKGAVVLFPVAVVEEHGPHMTVSVDIYLSYLLARETQKKLKESKIDSVIAPPFYWGVNGSTQKVPGSFCISRDTVVAILTNMFMSLKDWGFRKIIAFSGHGEPGHLTAIDEALKAVEESDGKGVYMRAPFFGVSNDNGDPDNKVDDHAGATETSIMMHYFSDHVKVEKISSLKPTEVTYKDYLKWQKDREFFRRTSPLGYLGDPASATPDVGRRHVEEYIENSMPYILERLNAHDLI